MLKADGRGWPNKRHDGAEQLIESGRRRRNRANSDRLSALRIQFASANDGPFAVR